MAAATNYVPLAARILWFGTVASIPSGWTRDTNFDDRFLQGSTIAGSTGGGGHTHSQSHSHSGVAHNHTFTGAEATVGDQSVDRSGAARPKHIHSHGARTSISTAITYQNDTTPADSSEATPPYVTAIVIKPNDATQHIPDAAVCFTDETSAPAGFSITNGSGGTIDLSDKFIIGADVGNDGGSSGGSTTHTHTISPHTHTPDTHGHGNNVGGDSTYNTTPAVAGETIWDLAHHWVRVNTKIVSDPSSVALTIDNATYEPAYTKLLGIQNTSGSSSTPLNVVVLFDGLSTDIPSNWTELDGSGGTVDLSSSQIKVTTLGGEVGDTGGNNNHAHTTASHLHTHSSHTHTTAGTTGTDHTMGHEATGPIFVKVAKHIKHSHNWSDASAFIPAMGGSNVPLNSSDGRYKYRTVLFVKKTSLVAAVGNAILFGANF